MQKTSLPSLFQSLVAWLSLLLSQFYDFPASRHGLAVNP